MNILVVSQYFYPESFIINQLVKILSSQGHNIKVLTGKPNYPSGQIFEGYTEKGTFSEQFAGNIEVFRAPLRPRKTGGAKNLALNYLSFVVNGLLYFPRSVYGEKYDVILVFATSPITSAIPAIYLKWKLKTHLAIWIQDLWPESLSATGFVKNKFLLGLVGKLVKWIYGRADTLLVQSKAFINPVSSNADSEKIVYYPNSYETPKVFNGDDKLPDSLRHILDTFFCIVFAGNLGTAQSVETLVAAAEKLKHLDNVRIILVGSGSRSAWLAQQKVKLGLDNLVLAGRFPPDIMPQIFIRAQGLLVTLKREEIFSYTIPGKVQAYLAAGKPIIAGIDGEGARVVKEAGAGFTCPAEDSDGLVNCIEKLYAMPESERQKLGSAGIKYFLKHFEMTEQAKELINIIENRIYKGMGK